MKRRLASNHKQNIIMEQTTKKTAKELYREAVTELNQKLAKARIEVLTVKSELGELNADDDYKATILEVLGAFGGTLPLATLGLVLPDSQKLAAARKELREPTGDTPAAIREEKDGTVIHIKLVVPQA